MSYARFAIDSNVYVWADDKTIYCIVDHQAFPNAIDLHFTADFTLDPGEAERSMLGHLIYLRDGLNVMVPQRTVDKLIEDMTPSLEPT